MFIKTNRKVAHRNCMAAASDAGGPARWYWLIHWSRCVESCHHASAASSVFHDFSPRTDLDDGKNGGGSGASAAAVSDEDGALEIQGRWARAWVNCGTADELAFDVLLNALQTLAAEEVPALSKVVVGGELPWWPVPRKKGATAKGGGGEGPEEEDRELEGLLQGDF